MGRARVLIGRAVLTGLYVDRGLSLRETARALGVNVRTVERRLIALGITTRGKAEAQELARVRVEPAAATACRACERPDGPVCRSCRRDARAAARRGGCAWRDCREHGTDGWCYAHGKRIRGLMA